MYDTGCAFFPEFLKAFRNVEDAGNVRRLLLLDTNRAGLPFCFACSLRVHVRFTSPSLQIPQIPICVHFHAGFHSPRANQPCWRRRKEVVVVVGKNVDKMRGNWFLIICVAIGMTCRSCCEGFFLKCLACVNIMSMWHDARLGSEMTSIATSSKGESKKRLLGFGTRI